MSAASGSSRVALVLLACFAAVGAQALHQAVTVDFYSGVVFNPPDAWFTAGRNELCGLPDHYTFTTDAPATIEFVGDRIQVDGIQNNASGVVSIVMDSGEPQTVNLWSEETICDTLIDLSVPFGSHTLVLSLIGLEPLDNSTLPNITNEVVAPSPQLHLTNITYFVPLASQPMTTAFGTPVASSTPAFVGDTATSSHKNVGAIVGAVVGSVVGLAAIAVGLLYLHRKRTARKSRHAFNPNSAYVVELSPRTATAVPDYDSKFGAYTQMEDDFETKSGDVKVGGLEVPTLEYSPSKGTLRSRSRSPAPDRNPMP